MLRFNFCVSCFVNVNFLFELQACFEVMARDLVATLTLEKKGLGLRDLGVWDFRFYFASKV